MQLKEIICYNLFLVQVHLVQTPSPSNLSKSLSHFIEPTVSALECLKTIITETFRFRERNLISLTVTGVEEDTYDLQKMVIRFLNEKGNASLQLLDEPPHPTFISSIVCYKENNTGHLNETCRKNFVLKESTDFYVIFAHGLIDLRKRLYSACNSTTFNPFALYLIYWRHSGEDLITDVLPTLSKYQMWKVILAEEDTYNDIITAHVLQLKLQGPGLCLEKSRFTPAGHCQSPNFVGRLNALLSSNRRLSKRFKNCTIQVIAMTYEPFVINAHGGFEIKLLEEMAKRINVNFDIELSMAYADWGNKVNGTWDGNFGKMINTLKVGIGNVGPEADRLEDFQFTYSHKSPMLVWVVPIAGNVEKWRVVTMIFTLELWTVIFTVFILLWVLFVSLSRLSEDNDYLQTISGGLLASLQLFISSSVHNTPKTHSVRSVFAGGLLFGLIVTCLYSSYLINVLTKAIKEHQIENEKDILESNLVIGGLEEYLERFQKPDGNGCDLEICKRYQYFQNENDTAQFWLRNVEKRIACTPLTRSFVQYYMVKTFKLMNGGNTDDDSVEDTKRPVKLFIINEPINFYPIAIVLSKGNPFIMGFDRFIKKFIEAGLVYTLQVKYKDDFRKLQYLEKHSDEGPEQLTIYHLQAAFAILGFGCVIALVVFVVEKLWHLKYCTKFRRKVRSSRTVTRRNPRDMRLYYDWKYGNMYGKNYPVEFGSYMKWNFNKPTFSH